MSEPRDEEVIQREQLLLAAMRFAVRFARAYNVSLDQLITAARSMYFRQLRMEGLSMDEICEVMKVSARTAHRIGKSLKEDVGHMEAAHTIPTRIEFLLWTISLTRGRMLQALPDLSAQELDDALAVLLQEGRVHATQERTPKYALSQQVDRRVRPGWFHRIGAVNSLLGHVFSTIQQRFGAESVALPAFSRTLTFRVRPEDEAELQALYEQVWETCARLDAQATDEEASDARPIKLSFLYSSAPEH